jgi:hypothetical protein
VADAQQLGWVWSLGFDGATGPGVQLRADFVISAVVEAAAGSAGG